ncbi:hypothetical protein IQ07DRAFT_483449, partial [Pyrenochaeta sp. DS3sAY3a]
MNAMDNPLFTENRSIEPDLGDQRKSTYKALPAPPKTPRRVIKKYRFSAIVPFLFVVASFVLSLVILLAGKDKGTFEGVYLVSLNTSRLGQDIIKFEQASSTSTSTSPSATSSAGVAGVYYAYLGSVCTSNVTEESPGTRVIRECKSWADVSDSESSMSSVVIGRTRISVPLLAKLTSSVEGLSGLLASARKTIMAFLIISSVASGMSAMSTVPAIVFRESRLLVYFNVAWPVLASFF